MRTRDIAIAAMFQSVRRDPTVCEPRITINQQPHDAADAARLLAELEKKAEDRLISSVRVENNRFQCQVIAHQNHSDDTVTGRAIFVLNGLRHVVDHNEGRYPQETTEMRIVQGLVQKVAEKIAVEMIAPAFRGLRS